MTKETHRLVQSLYRLRGLSINVPEIIYCAPEPHIEETRIQNVATVKSILTLLKPTYKIVLPNRTNYDYLDESEAREELKDYAGEELVILKAPKTKPNMEGYCQPGPYYNTVTVIHEDKKQNENVIWGQAFKGPYQRGIMDLSNMLQRVRLELDGSRLRFSYHDKGEGIFGDKVLLWGEA